MREGLGSTETVKYRSDVSLCSQAIEGELLELLVASLTTSPLASSQYPHTH